MPYGIQNQALKPACLADLAACKTTFMREQSGNNVHGFVRAFTRCSRMFAQQVAGTCSVGMCPFGRVLKTLKKMVGSGGETSNHLFETLEDWSAHLKAENVELPQELEQECWAHPQEPSP